MPRAEDEGEKYIELWCSRYFRESNLGSHTLTGHHSDPQFGICNVALCEGQLLMKSIIVWFVLFNCGLIGGVASHEGYLEYSDALVVIFNCGFMR